MSYEFVPKDEETLTPSWLETYAMMSMCNVDVMWHKKESFFLSLNKDS